LANTFSSHDQVQV